MPGPAGRFLEGGHPVDVTRLLRGNVLVTSGDVTDEAASVLAGVLLLRLAEQLSHGEGGRGLPPCSAATAARAWAPTWRPRGSGSARRCGCGTPRG
jgi:hypothetical protein